MEEVNKGTVAIISGLILVGMNLFVLAPFVADQVEAGVGDVVAEGYDDPTDYEDEEWLVQKSERAYFAYSIVDQDALSSEDPSKAFEKMGPFIYEVTTTREVLDFNSSMGTVTYSEFDSFEWCEGCTWNDSEGMAHASLPGDTDITNVNILWNTQRMAGLSTGITYGEIFAKSGFANKMMEFELQNKAPSIWASQDISAMIEGASSALQAAPTNLSVEVADSTAPSVVLSGAYSSWLAQSGSTNAAPDFANISTGSIMYTASDPSSGTCIALTCDFGPVLIAGMGEPNAATTELRAGLLGYGDLSEPDLTLVDWTVYSLAGAKFLENGGGANLSSVDDLRERLNVVTMAACNCMSGVDITNPVALDYVIFGMNQETGLAAGLLTTADFNGIPIDGVALFLLGAQSDAFTTMVEYGIGLSQLLGLSDWAGEWTGLVGVPTEFPMILVGGSGTMDAQKWWETSFGGIEPIAGGYIAVGLNRESYEGTISLDQSKVREILYDSDYSLTSDFSRVFIYGELSGVTLPLGEDGPIMGGTEMPWDDSYVSGLYGISISEAAALRSWVKDFMFEEVIGALLSFQYGASALTTQSISNWLYGWSDSVLVGLYGEENSWVSLETNATYYGSNGKSTGDYSVYVMSTGTGAQDRSTTGQRLMQGYINSDGDGICDTVLDDNGDAQLNVDCAANTTYALTEHLPWRAPHKEAAVFRLLTPHVGNNMTSVSGTIGGIADADDPFKVNLVGYAITESEVGEKINYKGIEMVEHSIDLDPSENQIQAKLVGSGLFVDILPGALPVYFGSHVDIKVEPVTNVAMYGKSVSRFYLDLRGPGSMNPDFSNGSIDTHPVFEIHTFSEISDDDAATFKGKVLDNMDPLYWTDFGGSGDTELEGTAVIDVITLLLYLGGASLIAIGGRELMPSGE